MGRKSVVGFVVVLGLLLGMAVGTARAQPGYNQGDQERAVRQAKAMNDSLESQFDAMGAILSSACFLVFLAGFVVGAAIVVRWYLRLQAPSDPNQLVMNDPWVREHLARQNVVPAPRRPPADD